MNIYEEAADLADLPESVREKVISIVVDEAHEIIVSELAERMHRMVVLSGSLPY